MVPPSKATLKPPEMPSEDGMRLFLEVFTGDDAAEERRGLIDVLSQGVSKSMKGPGVPHGLYTQVMSYIAAMPEEQREACTDLLAEVVDSVAAKGDSAAEFAADGGGLTNIFRRKNTTPIYRYMPGTGSQPKDVDIQHARRVSRGMAEETLDVTRFWTHF